MSKQADTGRGQEIPMPSFTCSLCCSWQLEEDCRILPRPPCTVHEWDKTPYDGALPRGPCTRATRPVASGLRGIPAARCEFRWHCFRYHRHPVQAAGVSAKPGVGFIIVVAVSPCAYYHVLVQQDLARLGSCLCHRDVTSPILPQRCRSRNSRIDGVAHA